MASHPARQTHFVIPASQESRPLLAKFKTEVLCHDRRNRKRPQPLPNSSLLNLLELARTIHSAMCTAKQDLPWDTRQALRVLPNKRST